MVWYELHWQITTIPILVVFFAQLPTKMLERPRHRLGISLLRFDIFWYVLKRFLVLGKTSSYKVRLWSSLWSSVKQHFNGSWMFTLEWWTPQAPRDVKKNPNHEKPWITRLIPFPPITILITKINETLRNNSHWLCFGGIYEESFLSWGRSWTVFLKNLKTDLAQWATCLNKNPLAAEVWWKKIIQKHVHALPQ
jgi:hypothetical protein